METSSYLFMSKRKRLLFSSRIMEKHSSSDSNISMDSLEEEGKRKFITKDGASDENVDTILVPFYENDVLIKVPKGQKRNQKKETNKYGKQNEKIKKEWPQPNYLVNKGKLKQTTYLDMFRKQFSSSRPAEKESEEFEISSLLPEFGDTEVESIGEEINNNPVTEFYNTEPYNEMFYEKILNKEISYYLDNSCEEGIRFGEDIGSKTPDENDDNNLRSVSEVAQHRRPLRRNTAVPIPNVKLGGLGPDIEKIKPRLDRARSLQRYSEKVRMENRLRIYKKSIQAEEKKTETEISARRREFNKEPHLEQNTSYLVNKTQQEQKLKITKKIYEAKSKSADVQRNREGCRDREKRKDKMQAKKNDTQSNSAIPNQRPPVGQETIRPKKSNEKVEGKMQKETESRMRAKSSSRSKGINTEIKQMATGVPPVQISFLVNVGGLRPSSALKSLEEKHRMYQEQVKAFTMDRNDI